MFSFGGRQFAVVWIVEWESLEFVLVDGPDQFWIDGCQDRLLFREFRIKIKHIFLIFLELEKSKYG